MDTESDTTKGSERNSSKSKAKCTFTAVIAVIVGLNSIHEQTSLAADLAANNGHTNGERGFNFNITDSVRVIEAQKKAGLKRQVGV